MSLWAVRDASRIIHRARHYATTTASDRQLGAERNGYLRGQIIFLLTGPLRDELPALYVVCLQELLGVLEGVAAACDEEDPA